MLLDTYAEFSPSGRGIRLFFKGYLGNGKALRDGDFGMECFSTKGFVTFTGNALDITELLGNTDVVAPLSEAALSLHAERFARESEPLETGTSGEPAGLTLEQAVPGVPQPELRLLRLAGYRHGHPLRDRRQRGGAGPLG